MFCSARSGDTCMSLRPTILRPRLSRRARTALLCCAESCPRVPSRCAGPLPEAAPGSNEQKIGDGYASCMDVDAINRKGNAPLQPELDRIAALKSKAELPALLAHLHAIGVNAFFAHGANPDYGDATQVISFYAAAGLGLPERDYYTRTDAKSVEERQKYVAHVGKILHLAGSNMTQRTVRN